MPTVAFFTEEWAEAARRAVNDGPDDAVKAQKRDKFWVWIDEAKEHVNCRLALTVRDMPDDRPDCLLLDLQQGRAVEARLLPRARGEDESHFLLAADYADWQEIMDGFDMGKAIMYRKLLLEKGDVLHFFQAAYYWTESLACIQRIPTSF